MVLSHAQYSVQPSSCMALYRGQDRLVQLAKDCVYGFRCPWPRGAHFVSSTVFPILGAEQVKNDVPP